MIKYIDGGVCAPAGFKAAGVACGLRKNNRKDLALIVSETPAAAAGTYTSNLVKGAPLLVTKQHLQNGYARAVIVNSGNANTCAPNGVEIAEGMCSLVEKAGLNPGRRRRRRLHRRDRQRAFACPVRERHSCARERSGRSLRGCRQRRF
jgi:N-acetylglutamate synthase/N-acetylornithine aminotransferase